MMGNGDIFTQEDADEMRRRTGVSGVMSARGLLANPVRGFLFGSPTPLWLTCPSLYLQALFEGFDKTPLSVIQVRIPILNLYVCCY